MSKERALIGLNGQPLPVLPPDRDARVWARMVRVMFYTPGFMALLLIKAGEPAGFALTVELLMLASAAAMVAGLFIGTQSAAGGSTSTSRTGVWSGALVLELLSAVPFLCVLPPLFHQLVTGTLLHAAAPGAVDISLGASELVPMLALFPYLLYQLGGFGTLSYVVSKRTNWLINGLILVVTTTGYLANRQGEFVVERVVDSGLCSVMVVTAIYGISRLKALQAAYDANVPPEEKKKKKDKDKDKEGHKHKHKDEDKDEDKGYAKG
jgi:hypothetical protein